MFRLLCIATAAVSVGQLASAQENSDADYNPPVYSSNEPRDKAALMKSGEPISGLRSCSTGFENEKENTVFQRDASCTVVAEQPFVIFAAAKAKDASNGNTTSICFKAFNRETQRFVELNGRSTLCRTRDSTFVEIGPIDVPSGAYRLFYSQNNSRSTVDYVGLTVLID